MDDDRDLQADLDEWLVFEQGEPIPMGDEEGWVPSDEGDVDRLLRHLGRAQAEEARLRAFHAEQVAKLDEWLADRTAGAQAVQEGTIRSLEGWARKVHAGPSGHVWDLPSGVLRLTAAKNSLAVTDEAAAVAWCEANSPQLVNKTVDKSGLKALLRPVGVLDGSDAKPGRVVAVAATEEGEMVAGVQFEKPDRPSFTVKTK